MRELFDFEANAVLSPHPILLKCYTETWPLCFSLYSSCVSLYIFYFCPLKLVLGEMQHFFPFVSFRLQDWWHCSLIHSIVVLRGGEMWDTAALQTDPATISRGLRFTVIGLLKVQTFFPLLSPPLFTVEFKMCTGYFYCFSTNTVGTVLPGGTYFTGVFPVKELKPFYTHRTGRSIKKKTIGVALALRLIAWPCHHANRILYVDLQTAPLLFWTAQRWIAADVGR